MKISENKLDILNESENADLSRDANLSQFEE
jgi:hypothetical protein